MLVEGGGQRVGQKIADEIQFALFEVYDSAGDDTPHGLPVLRVVIQLQCIDQPSRMRHDVVVQGAAR